MDDVIFELGGAYAYKSFLVDVRTKDGMPTVLWQFSESFAVAWNTACGRQIFRVQYFNPQRAVLRPLSGAEIETLRREAGLL